MANAEDNFPEELQERLSSFDESLSNFEELIKSLHETPLNQVQADMKPLDKAKLELVGVYALNSLYWMYLNIRGENPKEHSIRQELERVKSYMKRVKDITDKEKAPKLDKDASKRFVRSALWQEAQKKKKNKKNGEVMFDYIWWNYKYELLSF
ncbi:hypothetical protein CAPTEDRAFT_102365 [Capitella teleta]|uniref:Nuclear nucleic acid-binding protein C1D n=1 Tax=Capitella teleta TaxID=283909 RepID=R7UAX2_CAPTE|nr:hypothetical protein CAPTEDRAFT_102365 [Capitella teleta]|eukprot:ELU03495.1 hypothetical protein CAPTEDRAFT_102365 [Capitella teleta]